MSVQVTLSGVPVQVAHPFVCSLCDRCCKTRQALSSHIRNLHAAEMAKRFEELPPGATIGMLLQSSSADSPVVSEPELKDEDEPELNDEDKPEPDEETSTLRRGANKRGRMSAKAKLEALAAWEGLQEAPGIAPAILFAYGTTEIQCEESSADIMGRRSVGQAHEPGKIFLTTDEIKALLEHLLAGKRRRSGVACLASLARNGIAMSHPKKHVGHFIRVPDLKSVCDALGEDFD